MGSPDAAVHSLELKRHEEKIKLVGELCDLFTNCQYGFLDAREHLMSEGMVKEMMQKDQEEHKKWKKFIDVDKWWEHIMQIFKATPHWMALLDVHKIVESAREASNVTERIQNAIHDVLSARREQMGFLREPEPTLDDEDAEEEKDPEDCADAETGDPKDAAAAAPMQDTEQAVVDGTDVSHQATAS